MARIIISDAENKDLKEEYSAVFLHDSQKISDDFRKSFNDARKVESYVRSDTVLYTPGSSTERQRRLKCRDVARPWG